MFKVYNSNHQFQALIDRDFKNVQISSTIEDGYNILELELPCTDEYLRLMSEENYIETADYSYIIKEIIAEENDFIKIYAYPNIEDITGVAFEVYDVFSSNPRQAYEYTLQNSTDWTVEYNSSINTSMTLQTAQVNAMDMIREIAAQNAHELWFDTKNKVLRVYDTMGVVGSTYYSNELRLKQLRQQSSSYDLVTRITPIGKDGLRINLLNNNRDYLEDYTYCNKSLHAFYFEPDCDRVEILLAKARKKLAELSMPRINYKISLAELGPTIGLGDTIFIVDNIKKIKTKQRVVGITRYPFQPELDSVELTNLPRDFATEYLIQQKIRKLNCKAWRLLMHSLLTRILYCSEI